MRNLREQEKLWRTHPVKSQVWILIPLEKYPSLHLNMIFSPYLYEALIFLGCHNSAFAGISGRSHEGTVPKQRENHLLKQGYLYRLHIYT